MRSILQDVRYALRQLPLGFTQLNVLNRGNILNATGNLSNGIATAETNIAQTAYLPQLTASVGLYGLLSFAVAQRMPEIGHHTALGAPQASILNLVLRQALLWVAAGLTIGGVLAWFAVTLARGYIFGVQAHDALTFTVVVLVLAAASFVAAWLPAPRAASVDPILALRSE